LASGCQSTAGVSSAVEYSASAVSAADKVQGPEQQQQPESTHHDDDDVIDDVIDDVVDDANDASDTL